MDSFKMSVFLKVLDLDRCFLTAHFLKENDLIVDACPITIANFPALYAKNFSIYNIKLNEEMVRQ